MPTIGFNFFLDHRFSDSQSVFSLFFFNFGLTTSLRSRKTWYVYMYFHAQDK